MVARHKPVHIAPARDHDWQADSDMIFTQITSGDFPTFELANQAVCLFYVPDMKISRGGIAHALGRLEKHYQDHPTIPVARAGGEA